MAKQTLLYPHINAATSDMCMDVIESNYTVIRCHAPRKGGEDKKANSLPGAEKDKTCNHEPICSTDAGDDQHVSPLN